MRQEESEAQARRPDGSGLARDGSVELALLSAPDLPAEVGQQLAEELPRVLSERVNNRVSWEVSIKCDPLAGEQGGTPVADEQNSTSTQMLNEAHERAQQEGWDLAVCLTDLPLRVADWRPLVAAARTTQGVAFVSLPALGAIRPRLRARDAIVWLVDELVGESLEPDQEGEGHDHRIGGRLADLMTPVERVEPTDDDSDVRFVSPTVCGQLRLLVGTVRANRPARLALGLRRALAVALATSAFAIVTSDIWRVSDALGALRLAILMVASVVAMVTWLIIAHNLWERSSDQEASEWVVLDNAATVVTLSLGVLVMYVTLFVADLLGAWFVLAPSLLEAELSRPVGWSDYMSLAWLATSASIVGGALGSGFESEDAVRAAYSYRHRRRNECDEEYTTDVES